VRKAQGLDNRLFAQGVALTSYVEAQAPSGWAGVPKSYSEPREVELSNWGESWFALILDSSDDGVENYDRILVSADRIVPLADLRQGEWSGWLPITLRYEVANDYNLYTPKKSSWEQRLSAIEVETRVRIKPILLGRRDFFRIRFHYDDLNRFLAKPAGIADAMTAEIGPMVDFADNFPPQLVYYPEDKATFLEEARMSMEWHREAARYLATRTGADVVIHDIYTPNQFLTSRWWMRYLDPASVRYGEIGESQRKVLWEETFEIYEGIDRILGSILDNVGDDAYVVLSSDHGAIPLDTEVRLNNLFAREGLLRYSIDPETGYHAIDWDNTRVVFLKMDNVYINPDGLAGNYVRGSGDEYEVLRKRVIALLENLEDEDGRRPLAAAVRWEDAEFLDLPEDRVGDLIIANAPGFNWTENVGRDMEVFAPALASGYKQAVNPARSNGLWTPFIVYGPGVRRNHEMAKPIRHIDQYPTIMRLIGRPVPSFVEGTVIEEVLEPE
jgi:predicted AlkP superfamily phosphohydrolase/phosphomutase